MKDVKLKVKEVKPFRDNILKTQGHRCALCGGVLLKSDACLDHDHTTGRVRGAVHSDCNILLGKIENFVKRQGKAIVKRGGLENFLSGVYNYMHIDYTRNPFHPTHLTAKDKQARLYRRRIKASKTEATKNKYRKLLGDLK